MTTTMTRPTLSHQPEVIPGETPILRGRGFSFLERFRSRYVVDPSGCWLWRGALCSHPLNYGQIYRNGRREMAHRVAWELANGRPVPAGLDVMHLCDVPLCVNPDHLRPGTRSENLRHARDMGGWIVNRNRGRKITAADAVEIRRAYAAGEANQPELARRYGLSQPFVGYVLRRRKWAHAEEAVA